MPPCLLESELPLLKWNFSTEGNGTRKSEKLTVWKQNECFPFTDALKMEDGKEEGNRKVSW